MSVYRVLVTGSRAWDNPRPIEIVMRKLVAQYGIGRLIVIEGGAPGVDTLTRKVCEDLHVHCLEMKALWNFHQRGAGPVRNNMMLSLEPDLVIAFHWDLNDSKGTKDCYEKAKKLGIKTVHIKVPRTKAITRAEFWNKLQADKPKRKRKRASDE